MATSRDTKKADKNLYSPKTVPAIVDVPAMPFAVVEGKGDPNGPEFAGAIGALYTFSYTVKMSYKSGDVPEGYYPYTVFPLEGEWDLGDKDLPISEKSNYVYRVMIRQPDFLTDALFVRFLAEAKKKKANEYLDQLRLEEIREGLCCQMLHVGPYDDEPASFARMDEYCRENGYQRAARTHREIYLSAPGRTPAAKMKTILRYKVERADAAR